MEYYDDPANRRYKETSRNKIGYFLTGAVGITLGALLTIIPMSWLEHHQQTSPPKSAANNAASGNNMPLSNQLKE